ncbi:hypothetical protein JW960_28595 [candidate division KSB1 bacterium]|nr:hypothetical protein [candidate division KSB1 bacterium]
MTILITVIVYSLNSFTLLYPQQVGDEISEWSQGYLDIHFINIGKGECALCILPDGTTLLIDAGVVTGEKRRIVETRPSDSRTPGEWMARYIQRMLAFKSQQKIDYFVLSHFHDDHMGYVDETMRLSSSGDYRLSGITEVAEYVKIDKIIDRGWPDYSYPIPDPSEMVENYRRFLKYQQSANKVRIERFKPGLNDQITLLEMPEKYPNFEIRNVAANGEIWTGVAQNTRKHFPPLAQLDERDFPSENMCSIAIRMSYGAFDLFSGGDLSGVFDEGEPIWHDVETPVAQAVGPVEVNVLNHHGAMDSQNAYFLSALRPRVHILQAWSSDHPTLRTLKRLLSERIYPGPRDIFATNIMEANKIVIGNRLKELKSDQGHIVVRVNPGGERYRVLILDDSEESYRINAIHGPYQSR